MKRVYYRRYYLFFVCAFFLCAGCNNYKKANTALDYLKENLNQLDSLMAYEKYQDAAAFARSDQEKGIDAIIGTNSANWTYNPAYIQNMTDANTAALLTELNYRQIMIVSFHDQFDRELKKVANKQKQLELIQRFDRIYVLRIEK